MKRLLRRALLVSMVLGLPAPAAHAFSFDERLDRGDKGRPVRALQVRVAGWYRGADLEAFDIDGRYGSQTARAVKAFEEAYGLKVDGIAGKDVFEILHKLQDKDGSTAHFDWSEFEQNSSSTCSAKANAYAGTLSGGVVSPRRTRMYVRRLMWRLEAVRKKARGHAIAINSGFRSVPYNDCIGGARASQHMYGTAADARQVGVTNRRQRRIAKRSQFHGIGCYSSQTHNHLDLRMDNTDLPSQRAWWLPDRDSRGRELDEAGVPCFGETTSKKTTSIVRVLGASVSTSAVPSARELDAFTALGEGHLLDGVD